MSLARTASMMASFPEEMGRAVRDSTMRWSTPLSASLIQDAASDEPLEVEGRCFRDGEDGAEFEDDDVPWAEVPLLSLACDVEPLSEKAEGALAYLLFLSLVLVGEEALEVEGELESEDASSLSRFFCGESE